MMTLEEAIKHCKDVALSCTNKECALEHFQLLKWLQEYSNMLEKQGEQKPVEPQQDMLSQEKYAEAVDECVYGEKKLTDKVEPKFKNGQWIVWQGKCYKVNNNGCGYELVDQNGLSTSLEYGTIDENAHLWDITKNAKDGDVLAYVTDEENLWIMIYLSLYEPYEGHVHYHALLANDNFSNKGTCCICIDNLKPATKEQRDLLFQKMKEAGYEWDAENKKLKKIEQIQVIDYPDSLPKDNWELIHEFVNKFGRIPKDEDELNALVEYVLKRQKSSWTPMDEQRVENLLAIIEGHGYPGEVKWLNSLKDRVQFKQGEQKKLAWSEEDEMMIKFTLTHFRMAGATEDSDIIKWLKSLKDRVQPQPKQKWSEEDEEMLNSIVARLHSHPNVDLEEYSKEYNWLNYTLKSLRPQSTWKPSDEQMTQLKRHCPDNRPLTSLYEQLKKLRE